MNTTRPSRRCIRLKVCAVKDVWGTVRHRAILRVAGGKVIYVSPDFPVDSQAQQHGKRKRDEIKAAALSSLPRRSR